MKWKYYIICKSSFTSPLHILEIVISRVSYHKKMSKIIFEKTLQFELFGFLRMFLCLIIQYNKLPWVREHLLSWWLSSIRSIKCPQQAWPSKVQPFSSALLDPHVCLGHKQNFSIHDLGFGVQNKNLVRLLWEWSPQSSFGMTHFVVKIIFENFMVFDSIFGGHDQDF